MIHLTECPRDAMQGIHEFIPSEEKINYLNALLKVGFPLLDAGSFVSPKAIPQLADTKAVFNRLDFSGTSTKILAIVANVRGAEEAVASDCVSFLGFPFSVSETFQKRNTNSTMLDSLKRVEEIQELCVAQGRSLIVYLSMAFGNPYGDEWNEEIVFHWARQLNAMGIKFLSLADTTGMSDPATIQKMFSALIPDLPGVTLSAHLHANSSEIVPKVKAAWDAGCQHFDTAIRGFGGCPMASDELTGNITTETVVEWCKIEGIATGLNMEMLQEAQLIADHIFLRYK